MQEPSSGRAASPAKRKRVESTESATAQKPPTTKFQPSTKKGRLASNLSVTKPNESKVLEAVETKYNVQIHSVISSSKIQKKVSSVLRHLNVPTAPIDASPFQIAQVSVLRAKGSDAGKLVSIAEIAKREIAGQEEGGTKGRWYQYIALGEEIKETPKEKTIVEETILGGQDDDDENKSEQDDFEYMKTPFERAIEGKPKKQAIPIMSLFLARVSIDELKRRYDEQTNVVISESKTGG